MFKPETVRALDGSDTKCSKSAWYDIMQPRVSVATTRDRELHHERRKIWEKAFTSTCESCENIIMLSLRTIQLYAIMIPA